MSDREAAGDTGRRASSFHVRLRVDGNPRSGWCDARMLLSDFLRETLGVTGIRTGCEHGVCGACTIRVDGRLTRACLMLAAQADDRDVQTVASLADAPGKLGALQRAFRSHHAIQCGYCIPGILMSISTLLDRESAPDEERIRDVLSGHLCRCTGYTKMIEAVLDHVASTAPDAAGGSGSV